MQNEMPYYLKDETIDLTELHKLGDYLENHGYSYKYDMRGHQIIVFYKDTGVRWFDVVCHNFSYGHEKGLLESWGIEIGGENPGDDFVRGWLTAKIAKALGVNVEDFTVQEPYPVINNWSDAESRGRREGYLSGLALSVAMIFNHVTDMASLDDPNILTDFNYAVKQHQKRLYKRERDQLIASLKDNTDERIKEAQESLDKKTIEDHIDI